MVALTKRDYRQSVRCSEYGNAWKVQKTSDPRTGEGSMPLARHWPFESRLDSEWRRTEKEDLFERRANHHVPVLDFVSVTACDDGCPFVSPFLPPIVRHWHWYIGPVRCSSPTLPTTSHWDEVQIQSSTNTTRRRKARLQGARDPRPPSSRVHVCQCPPYCLVRHSRRVIG